MLEALSSTTCSAFAVSRTFPDQAHPLSLFRKHPTGCDVQALPSEWLIFRWLNFTKHPNNKSGHYWSYYKITNDDQDHNVAIVHFFPHSFFSWKGQCSHSCALSLDEKKVLIRYHWYLHHLLFSENEDDVSFPVGGARNQNALLLGESSRLILFHD